MAFTAAQLTTLIGKFKTLYGISDDDAAYAADGLAVYCSDAAATAATVKVTDTTIVGDATGGTASDWTLTFANASDDTLGEVVTNINAETNWVAELLGDSAADSGLLNRKAATNCLLQANEQVLTYQNEEQLELLLANALASVEAYLGRDIMSTAYTEVFPIGRATDTLRLNHPKVTEIDRVAFETVDGLRCRYTGTDTNATVEVTSTAVITRSRVGATTTETESTFASNVSTTAMASTINALSGWEATAPNAYPSAYLVQQGVRNAKDQYVTLEVWEDTDTEYETDFEDGTIEFSWRVRPVRGRMFVGYTAGYSTLPSDLEQVVLSLAKGGYDAAKRSGGIKSEKLGDYSYTMADGGSTGGVVGSIIEHVPVLQRYMRWSP